MFLPPPGTECTFGGNHHPPFCFQERGQSITIGRLRPFAVTWTPESRLLSRATMLDTISLQHSNLKVGRLMLQGPFTSGSRRRSNSGIGRIYGILRHDVVRAFYMSTVGSRRGERCPWHFFLLLRFLCHSYEPGGARQMATTVKTLISSGVRLEATRSAQLSFSVPQIYRY